jgi:transposase InsO family protein
MSAPAIARPHTNGVVERWTGTLKYDHLYRIDVPSGHDLGRECEAYRRLYNQVRPHEALAFATPETAYVAQPTGPPARAGPLCWSRIGQR